MQTRILPELLSTADGQHADAILRNCVHCGFCLATCPTYQVRGDELDSPRGRIDLIKTLLETGEATTATRQHLDRCLGCRACETTCPSGVKYHQLLAIGQRELERRVPRSLPQRLIREALRRGLTSSLLAPAVRLAEWLRPLMPGPLRDKLQASRLPPSEALGGTLARSSSGRSNAHAAVILPRGCVQPALDADIDAATVTVLQALDLEVLQPPAGACCGAIAAHLDDQDRAAAQARANIDAWWPLLESGAASAIVSNASGCGLTLRDYADWFVDDPLYADKARAVAAATVDIAVCLQQYRSRWPERWTRVAPQAVAWHPPCTLQHGLRNADAVETTLRELGFDPQRPADAHLCCGSAGTYSLLQPELASELRSRKLAALDAVAGEVIVTANIGCQRHLAAASARPVLHWVQLLARR